MLEVVVRVLSFQEQKGLSVFQISIQIFSHSAARKTFIWVFSRTSGHKVRKWSSSSSSSQVQYWRNFFMKREKFFNKGNYSPVLKEVLLFFYRCRHDLFLPGGSWRVLIPTIKVSTLLLIFKFFQKWRVKPTYERKLFI